MPSSTSERTIRNAKDRAEAIRQNDRAFLTLTMSTREGRMWMWQRLSEARIFTPTEVADHATMAFREGARNTGLKLLTDIMAWCPETFPSMFVENTGAALPPQQDQSDD